ncbi:hypothetical protein JHD48_09815 [Sulfurimonas sp. SAG-AH-194-I05]|nr:hypothetical protein [Sulfurimonas sp. SAG-AH-194-I05]
MRNGSAYISTIIYTTKKLAKLAKSLRHSFRVEIDGESSISYKEDSELLNKILFNGETEEYLQDLNEMTPENYLDLIDNIIKLNMKKEYEVEKLKKVKLDPKDSQMRSKSLKYLTSNIQDEEFKKLLEKFSNTPNIKTKNDLIIKFETLDTKKATEKNLYKYISVIEKIGKAQGRREAKLSTDKVEFVEMVVKIPYENNITDISSEDMLLYNQDFFKKYFPDYDILVGVSHNDELHQMKKPENIEKWEKEHKKKYEVGESGNHSHLFITTKNNKTGEFDYWNQQHLVVSQYLRDMGHSEEVITEDIGYIDDKGIRHQTLTQVKNQGKNLQEFLYQDINNNLFNGKDYNAVLGFNDLSITQKQSMEQDKRKSINNRTRNGQHLEEELKKDRIQELENKLFTLGIEEENKKQDINKKQETLNTINSTIETKEETANNIEKSIQKLKLDRISVSKKDLENGIDIIATEIVDNKDNFKYAGNIVIKQSLRAQIVKEMRIVSKVDIYDNDIKKIEKKIQKKYDIKLNNNNIEIKGLKEQVEELTTENKEQSHKIDTLETSFNDKLEISEIKITTKLEATHNQELENEKITHKQEIKNIKLEHFEEIKKTDNRIFNLEEENKRKDKIIGTLKERIEKIKEIPVNKFNTFKDKVKNIFKDKNKIIKNDKKYKENMKGFSSQFTEQTEKLNIIQELHPKINEEIKKYEEENIFIQSRESLPKFEETEDIIVKEIKINFDSLEDKKEELNDYISNHTQ